MKNFELKIRIIHRTLSNCTTLSAKSENSEQIRIRILSEAGKCIQDFMAVKTLIFLKSYVHFRMAFQPYTFNAKYCAFSKKIIHILNVSFLLRLYTILRQAFKCSAESGDVIW